MTGENRFTPEQKRDIVLEFLGGRVQVAELCREHQVSSTTLYNWRDRLLEAGLQGLRGNGPSSREKQQEIEMVRMRELVGELALANYAMKRGRAVSTGKIGGGG